MQKALFPHAVKAYRYRALSFAETDCQDTTGP